VTSEAGVHRAGPAAADNYRQAIAIMSASDIYRVGRFPRRETGPECSHRGSAGGALPALLAQAHLPREV